MLCGLHWLTLLLLVQCERIADDVVLDDFDPHRGDLKIDDVQTHARKHDSFLLVSNGHHEDMSENRTVVDEDLVVSQSSPDLINAPEQLQNNEKEEALAAAKTTAPGSKRSLLRAKVPQGKFVGDALGRSFMKAAGSQTRWKKATFRPALAPIPEDRPMESEKPREVEEQRAAEAAWRAFPDCTAGELNLSAVTYFISKETIAMGPCVITGNGAQVRLAAPLFFRGRVTFQGNMTFRASPNITFDKPCIGILGDVFLLGGSVVFQDCHAQQWVTSSQVADAAAVVLGNVVIRGGEFRFENCTSQGQGPGAVVAIQGSLQQLDGSLQLASCQVRRKYTETAYERSYVISIEGSFRLLGGKAEAVKCEAKGPRREKTSTGFPEDIGSYVIWNVKVGLEVLGGRISALYAEGGGISAGSLAMSGGSMWIAYVRSFGIGGIQANKFDMSGGTVSIDTITTQKSGGAIYSDALNISGGSMSIIQTFAYNDGGAIWTNKFDMSGGNMSLVHTSAFDESTFNSGGGAIRSDALSISGGSMSISHTRTSSNGGAICTKEFNMSGGNVSISQALSQEAGGAIYSDALNISGGSMSIDIAKSRMGGAIWTNQFNMSGGNALITRAKARSEGGAIWTWYPMTFSGGSLFMSNTTAADSGGAIRGQSIKICNSVSVLGASAKNGGAIDAMMLEVSDRGNLTIHDVDAEHGGAIKSDYLHSINSTVSLMRTKAARHGGAIYTRQTDIGPGSIIQIQNTSAGDDGGALLVEQFLNISKAKLDISGASSAQGGGVAIVNGDLRLPADGFLQIRNAFADLKGGGLFLANGSLFTEGLSFSLSGCSSRKKGGLAYVAGNGTFQGHLLMTNGAAYEGGCLYTEGMVVASGYAELHRCTAVGTAGGVAADGLHLQEVRFSNCGAAAAASFTSKTAVKAGNMSIDGGLDDIQGLAARGLEAKSIDCSLSPSCRFDSPSSAVELMHCSRGEGRRDEDVGISCRRCPEDHARLTISQASSATCAPCPHIPSTTVTCEATKLAVPDGIMVDINLSAVTNLSQWARCPTRTACPCGDLNASDGPGEPAKVVVPMCAKGYKSLGCTECAENYARGDTNVLQCVECATWSAAPREVVQYISIYLGKNLVFFSIAVASVTSAKSKRAASSTVLNQLMAFAAVAGTAMSAAMQTDAFYNLQSWGGGIAQDVIGYLSLPVAFAQGQTSGPKMSGECLLPLLTGDDSFKTVHHAHLAMYAWPALLVAGLAVMKGSKLAMVVGTNVFLPGFTAHFGKYLVAFRLRPEDPHDKLAVLQWAFLPPGPPKEVAIALVLASIAGCFLLGVGSWVHLVQSRTEPLESYVAYLMQAYKTECSVWEVERLVRKMLLALIVTMCPVTYSPAAHMELVTLILIVSGVLYAWYRPYQEDADNATEMGLLVVAVVIMGLTTFLLASDLHWAKSTEVSNMLLFVISGLAAGVCSVWLARFGIAFNAERTAQKTMLEADAVR